MDEKPIHGGPAFPQTTETPWGKPITRGGLTVRDHFAGEALSGIIARRWEDDQGNVPDDIFDRWATAAYKVADAMLRARHAND